jgi:hypothetical protein
MAQMTSKQGCFAGARVVCWLRKVLRPLHSVQEICRDMLKILAKKLILSNKA